METMTPEKIEVGGRDDEAGHFAVHAVVRAERAGVDLKDARSPLEVVLIVNGKQVPFAKTIKDVYAMFEQSIGERAAKIAYSNARLSGLDKLRDTIERSDWEIREAIKDAFGVELESR